MNDYMLQSRPMRIYFYAFGVMFSLLSLVYVLLALSCAWSMGTTIEYPPETREFLAQLAKEAKQDAQAAETLRKNEESEREIARMRRASRYVLCAACLPFLAGMVLGIVMAGMPNAAARRRRRRAVAWETVRQGWPMYRNSLPVELLSLCLFLCCAVSFGVHVLDTPHDRDATIVLWVLDGLLLAFTFVQATWLLWRFHCRDWRIRLAEVPVRPGELVQFEIFRESGKPIDQDLCVELVGWQPRWNTKKDRYKSGWSILPRTIRGEVHPDVAPGSAPGSIRGTFRIEGTDLVAVPPDGVKYPRRLLPFLRVRRGWWRRCLFDLPAPALYVRPEAERQSSVDERPSGH